MSKAEVESESTVSKQWKISGWSKGTPNFVNPPEQPRTITRFGHSGHETYAISGENHKYYFKKNKKTGFFSRFSEGNRILSIQEVLAGASWAVYFPDHASDSALVYSENDGDVLGTISTGIQDWYELSKDPYPNDDKVKSHRIYVKKAKKDDQVILTYKVAHNSKIHEAVISQSEIEAYFRKNNLTAPSPESDDYIEKSFSAILNIATQKKHIESSHTLRRDCQFNDNTDYFSLSGLMVYSHTNCEDDLHRENILVINKNNKDVYNRIDFDMSYQSLTEKRVGQIMGISANTRSSSSRGVELSKIKITPKSFKSFPMGIHEPLHFWPGVRRLVVGAKSIWHVFLSTIGIRGSAKGWDESFLGNKNLTKQFEKLSESEEFNKWKVYHYVRYLTMPKSLIEKEMQFRVGYLTKIRNEYEQKNQKVPKCVYDNEESAKHLMFRLLNEDENRRKQFKQQLMKIPEFKQILKKNQNEYKKRMDQDNQVLQDKYKFKIQDIEKELSQQSDNFENLVKICQSQLAAVPAAPKKTEIQKTEIKIEAQAIVHSQNQDPDTAEKEKIIIAKQMKYYSKREQYYIKKIESTKSIPELNTVLQEANADLKENKKALAEIEELAKAQHKKHLNDAMKQLETLQTSKSSSLRLPDDVRQRVINFLKYTGGALAVLFIAKTVLPPSVFTAMRILGFDLFRSTCAHLGIVAGSLSFLGAVAAGVSLFSKSHTANPPPQYLMDVFTKVKEVCENSPYKLSDSNHPSDAIEGLIRKLNRGYFPELVDKLKQEFELNNESDQLLISQLKELGKALAPYAHAQSQRQPQTPNHDIQLDSHRFNS